ncbi:MAG: hypothetical protein ACOCP8_04330 [archaeon]
MDRLDVVFIGIIFLSLFISLYTMHIYDGDINYENDEDVEEEKETFRCVNDEQLNSNETKSVVVCNYGELN